MATKTDQHPRERAEFLCDTAGSILSVRVRGEIDHHTAAGIRQGIDGVLFEKRPKKLILDLSAVSFMDSSGLGLIMGRFSVMKELGGEMTVWNPSQETRSILTLAGMERLVRIEYPSEYRPSDQRASDYKTAESSGRQAVSHPAARTPRTGPRKRKKPSATAALTDRKEKDA